VKLWSREALVLGGIYNVLNIPFFILYSETLFKILFVAFFVSALMLCFNKTPKFISYIINHHPVISYYLCSFGWIIYFIIIALVGILLLAIMFEWQDKTLEIALSLYSFISTWGTPVSLLIAFLRTKIKKA